MYYMALPVYIFNVIQNHSADKSFRLLNVFGFSFRFVTFSLGSILGGAGSAARVTSEGRKEKIIGKEREAVGEDGEAARRGTRPSHSSLDLASVPAVARLRLVAAPLHGSKRA